MSLEIYVAASICDQVGEDVVTGETTEFANCGSDTVILATYGCGAGLRGEQTNIITRANFAKGEEDSGSCKLRKSREGAMILSC